MPSLFVDLVVYEEAQHDRKRLKNVTSVEECSVLSCCGAALACQQETHSARRVLEARPFRVMSLSCIDVQLRYLYYI